jgi:hypothetical protein
MSVSVSAGISDAVVLVLERTLVVVLVVVMGLSQAPSVLQWFVLTVYYNIIGIYCGV